jgi:ubiquinone/menaquinone biosynthesis C-methylase UbiE
MTSLKDKEIYELTAQHEWQAYTSSDLLDALCEYWRDFRYWEKVKATVPIGNFENVLDVGCGVTSVLNVIRRDFPHINLTGVDPLMDEYLKMYGFDTSITWKRQYLEDLAFPSETFDMVCCTNALDHVEDVEAAIHEIRRVLSRRGTILVTVDVFAKSKMRNEGHPYSFTRPAIFELLREFGFEVEWMRLSRRKLGMAKYTRYRLGRGMSPTAVFWNAAVQAQIRCYIKQLLARGAIGELVLVASKVARKRSPSTWPKTTANLPVD